MSAIIYESNTGSAEKYARMLSEKLSIPAVALSKSDSIDAEEEIIFIGWIMAGTVQGLAQARERFTNIKCVCFVGLMCKDGTKEEIAEKNQISEPLFFLPGDFHMDKLKGMYRMMMSMMMKMVKAKIKEQGRDDGDKMLAAFEGGIDQVSEEKLSEVTEFLSGQNA